MVAISTQTKWLPRKPPVAIWMAAAAAVAGAIALAILLILGVGEKALFIALRATGRWSFLLFWLAFVGRPLQTLLGPSFRPLAQSGREFGLSYAAAQTVHVGLIIWLYAIAARPPVPPSVLLFFAIGIFWTYLLAALSFRPISGRMNATLARTLRTLGVYYIGYAFAVDLARNPFHHNGLLDLILYLPFTAMIAAVIALRLVAFAVEWLPRWGEPMRRWGAVRRHGAPGPHA